MTRRLALGGLAAFVAIVTAQHALATGLSPARHTISEYVNADAGAVMVTGFLAWATSLLATAALVWRDSRWVAHPARGGGSLAALLIVAGAGMCLTGLFATQTSAGVLPPGVERTTGGRIHDLASGVATLALLGALLVSVVASDDRPDRLRAASAAALAIVVTVTPVLLAIGDPVDGIRQRVLVATACGWQATLIAATIRQRAP